MNEEQLRRLLFQLLGTGSTQPNLLQERLFPQMIENMARTNDEFFPTTKKEALADSTGEVGVVDTTRTTAQPVDILSRLRSMLSNAVVPGGAVTQPGQVPGQVAPNIVTAPGEIPGQTGFGIQQPFANLNAAAALGLEKVKGALGIGGPTPVVASPVLDAPRDASGLPTVVNSVTPAPLAVTGATDTTQLPYQQTGAAPNVSNPGLGTLGTINAAFQTPAVIQALAALGQGIAGQGSPVNVIGDAAIQMAQGQMVRNALEAQKTGIPAPALGPRSAAGLSAEGQQQVLNQGNAERRLGQEDRSLDIQQQEADARTQSAWAALMKAQHPGLESWQVSTLRQQVANDWHEQARANLLARNPSLSALVDIESILGSAATGVNIEGVLTNLTPEQREQASQQMAGLIQQVEQGAPFSSAVAAGGSTGSPVATTPQAPAAPNQQGIPRISGMNEFQALPVGSEFVAPDGRRMRKTGPNDWEQVQ